MREKVGREERGNSGRTAWHRIVGYLASRETGVPLHLTLGSGAVQYGSVGLWPHG